MGRSGYEEGALDASFRVMQFFFPLRPIPTIDDRYECEELI
jgi:hypothetical protein